MGPKAASLPVPVPSPGLSQRTPQLSVLRQVAQPPTRKQGAQSPITNELQVFTLDTFPPSDLSTNVLFRAYKLHISIISQSTSPRRSKHQAILETDSKVWKGGVCAYVHPINANILKRTLSIKCTIVKELRD